VIVGGQAPVRLFENSIRTRIVMLACQGNFNDNKTRRKSNLGTGSIDYKTHLSPQRQRLDTYATAFVEQKSPQGGRSPMEAA